MAKDSDRIRITGERQDFTAVPNWIIELIGEGELSRDAFTLYVILRKYSDYKTREAHPARSTLAKAMGFSTPKPLDKLIKELEKLGLILVERRRLEHAVNHYHVAYQNPFRVEPSAPEEEGPQDVEDGRVQTAPTSEDGGGSNGLTGRVQTDSRVGAKRTHYQEPLINNQDQETAPALFETEESAVALREKNIKQQANILAKRASDGTNNVLPFMGIRAISEHFLHQGFEPNQIEKAIHGLYTGGVRGVNKQTVGQVLQGIIAIDGQRPRQSAARRNLEAGIRGIEKLKAEEEAKAR